MKMSNKFITVSSDSDAWGEFDPATFNPRTEAGKIATAAELAGIHVAHDEDRRTVAYNDDGSERDEIGWFTTWCNGGYEWDEDQWEDWFAKRA